MASCALPYGGEGPAAKTGGMAFNRLLRIVGAALAVLFAACAFVPDAAASPKQGSRATDCAKPDRKGVQRCRTGLPRQRMQQLLRMQEDTQWCWAAGIAMVFASMGLEVEQGHVVRANFGELLNWPARDREITRLLNRRWQDRSGRAYVASARTSEVEVDISRHAPHLVEELASGRPVILAAMKHLVVLAEVEFERSADGESRIVGGTVLDPAAGRGIRPLEEHELKPTYLARIRVEPADDGEAGATHVGQLVLR
jgi:hypothetical protein